MADPEKLFDRIANELATRPGVQLARMFGMPGVKFKGKAFTGLFGEAMVFKLGAGTPAHANALDLKGGSLWDPSQMGRPFKDWVQVPLAQSKRWPEFAERAFALVSEAKG